jgi:hypothetical protein
MARLRQQHPQNYVNSGNIHTDFENLVRYINTAELGNKTVAELFAILFNEEGVFRGPVEMRVDTTDGIQYRVGMYNNAEEGWVTLVDIGSLKGPAGSNVGNVEGPFFFNRQDFEIGAAVASISVTGGGSGYTEVPTISFSSPTGTDGVQATATAVLTGDAVTAINIVNAGAGYTSAPTISFVGGGGGAGATATTTLASPSAVVPYTFDADTDDIVVYKNGILLHKSTSASTAAEYTEDSVASTVTLASAPVVGDKVSIYSVRSQSVSNYRREDIEITTATTGVAFVHTADEKLVVWRNGILQEPGGGADYISSSETNTITFNVAGGLVVSDVVTVITVENLSLKTVAGLMFEDEYTDENGFIKWSKLSVATDEIPQSKVSALSDTLANKANVVSSALAPASALTADLWLDISQVPAILKFYDGTQWLETSPESSLPTFLQSNASQYVRVNGTGTALEYGNIDFSAVVPKSFMGAANGVATLDTSAKLPVTQLPEIFATATIPWFSVWDASSVNVSNGTFFVSRLWKQKIRIDGITHKLSQGTCTVQISVDGSVVGTTHSVTSSLVSADLATVIEIDATTSSRRLEIQVTNSAGTPQNLEIGLAVATLSV